MSVHSGAIVTDGGLADASATEDSPHDLSAPPPLDESTVSADEDDMSETSNHHHHHHHDRLVVDYDDHHIIDVTNISALEDYSSQHRDEHQHHQKKKRRVKTSAKLAAVNKKPTTTILPPSPYETAAIRPSGKNPYIQLSLLKANTMRKAMGAKASKSLQSISRSQTSNSPTPQQQRPSPNLITTMPHHNVTTTNTSATTTNALPPSSSRLPRLDGSRPNTTAQAKKAPSTPSNVNQTVLPSTTNNTSTGAGGVSHSILLAPLKKRNLQPADTTTNAKSSAKKLLRHFVSISRTLEEACRAVEAENLLGRHEIVEAEENRRRQIERLYAPIHSRLLLSDQHQSTAVDAVPRLMMGVGISRSPTVAMLNPSISEEVLGQLSTHHQTITIEGLGHELVMVQLEEEDGRNTWVKRLWSDLKAIHRACRRLAGKIEQDCCTAKAELAKAQRAEQEEREFNYRQNEAERNEYYSRQIRQLHLDESKLRFAVEMEEYRATTILRYTEREHSTRALANSLKKMELQRAEERTTFVFGLFQDSFTEMERERIEDLYTIRSQYVDQGTALVLKYQAKARGDIEGKESTVRNIRQSTLCSQELLQLYIRSVEGREVIVRRTLQEEQNQIRGPLEERVGQYMDDVRSSLGTAEDLIKDMITKLFEDESGALAAIDLQRAREDMAVRYVKEAVANGERAARIAERLQSPNASIRRPVSGNITSSLDFENVFGTSAVKKLLSEARGELSQGIVNEAIESACTTLGLEYEQLDQEKEDAADDIEHASSAHPPGSDAERSITHTASSVSSSSSSDFTIEETAIQQQQQQQQQQCI